VQDHQATSPQTRPPITTPEMIVRGRSSLSRQVMSRDD
jgi:hypothetical protein